MVVVVEVVRIPRQAGSQQLQQGTQQIHLPFLSFFPGGEGVTAIYIARRMLEGGGNDQKM